MRKPIASMLAVLLMVMSSFGGEVLVEAESFDAPEHAGYFDFVVVGGGHAGTAAAIAAARMGVRGALRHGGRVRR